MPTRPPPPHTPSRKRAQGRRRTTNWSFSYSKPQSPFPHLRGCCCLSSLFPRVGQPPTPSTDGSAINLGGLGCWFGPCPTVVQLVLWSRGCPMGSFGWVCLLLSGSVPLPLVIFIQWNLCLSEGSIMVPKLAKLLLQLPLFVPLLHM